METITLAGGCFWCTEAIFKRLNGVESVASGYANSNKENPSYEEVCSGSTQAAEALRIDFDPEILPLEKILEVFFATHDPTTLNCQGDDQGTQYRSGIYYSDDAQKEAVEKFRDNLEKEGHFKDPIVTEIMPLDNFYTAEYYHRDYFDANPAKPYCSLIIAPKIRKLLEEFGKDVKDQYK